MVWIVWLCLLNALFLVIVAIREARRPANALNWLMICVILPVIGFGLYLSTSKPMRMRRERLTSPQQESDKLPASFGHSAVVIACALHPWTVHGLRTGRVQLLTNGIETFEKLIESIRNAKKTIDLEYYIYRYDQIGSRITDLLIERAAAGIKVRFVRDGFGSSQFPRRQIIRMMDAGIEFRTIFPVRFPWIISNWNYRDHCKIVMIDGKEAFTGGINVGDEYTGLKPNVGFWRDTHLKIAGDAAADLQAVFNDHWHIASPESRQTLPLSEQFRLPNTKTALSGWSTESSRELGDIEGKITIDENVPNEEAYQQSYVQTLVGNPGIPTPVIRQAYFICLTQAVQSIAITTPYFVPDSDIIMAIKTAITRGVRVRLLVPRHVDHLIVGLASRTYYGELLEAGVQIYLYDKGILHAKVMIIDEAISVVGAANFDMRSFRLDYEVSQVLYSSVTARELTEQFERDVTDSVQLCMEDLLKRSRTQHIVEQVARLFSPLL